MQDNIVHNSAWGICIQASKSCCIVRNQPKDNQYYSLFGGEVDGCTFKHNRLEYTPHSAQLDGFAIEQGTNLLVERNFVYEYYYAMKFYNVDQSKVIGNVCVGTMRFGARCTSSTNPNIPAGPGILCKNNRIINAAEGLYIFYSHEITFDGNVIYKDPM